MTDNEAPRTTDARRRLDRAVRAMDHVQARYEVAMLDYITARIVEAHPQTTHLTFVHATPDGLIELDGLWATHDGGTEELLHDLRGGESATVGFDPGEIGDDLTYALDRLNSVAWSAVRPQTLPGKRWVLDLPPADRAARIAALVRVHHPDAGLLTVDISAMRPRIAGVTTVGTTGVGPTVHAEPDRPLVARGDRADHPRADLADPLPAPPAPSIRDAGRRPGGGDRASAAPADRDRLGGGNVMSLTVEHAPAPAVPAVHAQTIAVNVLQTWPMAIGLTIEYVAHHDQGPRGAVTFAVVRAREPWPSPVLIRCDGYGHIARGCEHPRPDGQPCWHPSAPHLSLRDQGLCPRHLPPLAVHDWVRHPEQPLYGRVTRVDPDGTVAVDFVSGELTLHAAQVPRVPPHIANELDRGPLNGPVHLIED